MTTVEALNISLMIKCPRCHRRNTIKDEVCFMCNGTKQVLRGRAEMAEIIQVLRTELSKRIWKQK